MSTWDDGTNEEEEDDVRVCVLAIPITRIDEGFDVGSENSEVRDCDVGVIWSSSSNTKMLK